ncbi:hypothetical protein [Flocculibacter collagenilyticus]|uniref:hypothetical protein n=1 Tax=Flocculibacter collagenilyticus TaxID=2744479 RepID=UPI0018F6CA5F|nr:hypothetical protein [Flocculibacter collagenilyticus]
MLVSICTASACAEQLLFDKERGGTLTSFKYSWIDTHGRTQNFNFSIDNKKINSKFRNFKNYKPYSATRHIHKALERTASKLNPREAKAEITRRMNTIEISVTSKSEELQQSTMEALQVAREQALTDFLKKNYYIRFETPLGEAGVKPDHVRFATESKDDLQPLTKELVKKFPSITTKGLVEYILGFIQTIPYSKLDSRIETSGAGFSPPLKLLSDNLGDCDSKSVLMASLMKNAFPQLSVAIIYIPNHALLGLQLPHVKGDDTVVIEGSEYLLVEPTGPATLPYGKVAEQSKMYLDSGQFSYELL